MKKLLLVTLAVIIGMGVEASAATLTVGTHMNPFETSTRSTFFDQNIEAESAAVTKSGSWSNFSVGADVPWNKGTWLFSAGSYAEVSFTVAANTLFAQFEADSNDGIAEFWVDGALVGAIDTYNRGWVQASISGLTLGLHTMRIYARRNTFGADDLALDTFGALNSVPPTVPVPAALPMLLLAFGGLGFLARRRAKSAAEI